MKLRILEVLFEEVIPTPRDVVIICLADACGLFTELLPGEKYRQALPRIELVRKMDLIGREVMAAISDIWRVGRTLPLRDRPPSPMLLEPPPEVDLRPQEIRRRRTRSVPFVPEADHRGRDLEDP